MPTNKRPRPRSAPQAQSQSQSQSRVPALGYTAYGAPPVSPRKIAAFDLDGTLISAPASSVPHPTKWVPLFSLPEMRRRLEQAVDDGFAVVVISNQGGIRSSEQAYRTFKAKLDSVLEAFNVPCHAFFACSRTRFRKPMPGIWEHLVDNVLARQPDLESSFYVGDAAGRRGDHSDTDLKFAINVGIRFQTPQEFFACGNAVQVQLQLPLPLAHPRPYNDIKLRAQLDIDPNGLSEAAYHAILVPSAAAAREIILIAGRPASGKSLLATYISERFGYALLRGNKPEAAADAESVVAELKSRSVVIDGNLSTRRARQSYVKMAESAGHNVGVRLLVLNVCVLLAQHLDALRCLINDDAVGYTPAAFSKFDRELELPAGNMMHSMVPFYPRYAEIDARLPRYKDMYLF